MKKIACLLMLLSVFAIAKGRNWQDGVVYNMASSNAGAAAAPIGNIMVAFPLSRLHYFVETSDLRIEAFIPGGKPLNITLKKHTQVAIEGDKLFLIDDSGKEKKLKIIQKAAKSGG